MEVSIHEMDFINDSADAAAAKAAELLSKVEAQENEFLKLMTNVDNELRDLRQALGEAQLNNTNVLNTQLTELQSEKSRLEAAVFEQTEARRLLLEQNANLQNNVLAMNGELKVKTNDVMEMAKENIRLENQVFHLQRQMQSNVEQLKVEDKEKHRTLTQIAEFKDHQKKFEARVEILNEEAVRSQMTKKDLENQICALNDQLISAKAAHQELSRQNQSAHVDLQQVKKQLEDAVKVQDLVKRDLLAEHQTHNRERHQLKTENEDLQIALASEKAKLRECTEKLEGVRSANQASQNESQKNQALSVATIAQLRDTLQSGQLALKNEQEKNFDLHQIIETLKNEKHRVESHLTSENTQLRERFSAQNTELSAELLQCKTNLEERTKGLQALEEQHEKSKRGHESDKARFEQYCSMMNLEKQKIQRILEQLVLQVRVATSVHPLKDIQKLTENDLNRIEKELKKTAAIDPRRPQLEVTLDQLIDQRNLLRDLILSAEKESGQVMNGIDRLSRQAYLATPSPMPA